MSTRIPAVAGSFYPSEVRDLKNMINDFMETAKYPHIDGKLKGLIVPHAGYTYSGGIAALGYKLLKEKAPKTEHIYLIGPSHQARFYGVVQSPDEFWRTPLGNVKMEQLDQTDLIKNNAGIHMPEHCLEVQIPFIQTILKDPRIYAFLTGDVAPLGFATQLKDNIEKDGIVIVSSDLSHYHTYNQANRLDSIANKAIPSLDIDQVEHSVEACGKDAIITLMHLARMKKWKVKMLGYKNSGDTSGMKDQVVGYGVYAFYSSD